MKKKIYRERHNTPDAGNTIKVKAVKKAKNSKKKSDK